MLVLQSGLPKSGNLWLHKILQESMRLGGIEPKSFIQSQPIYQDAKKWPGFSEQAGIDFIEFDGSGCYYRKGAYRQPVTNIDNYLSQCSHVWTHNLWTSDCEPVFARFDKIVYIARDPRDVAVSASRYFFTPFMLAQHPQQEPDAETFLKHRLYEQVLTWVQHTGGYLLHQHEFNIHFVFYERLLHDFDCEYNRLLEYLGLALTPALILQVKESAQFENMKKQNPHHLRKGESGGWINILNDDQARQVAKMAGPMMQVLGYACDSASNEILPGLPAAIDLEQVNRAISASHGTVTDKMRYAWAFATSRRSMREKLSKGFEFIQRKGRWNPNP